MLGYSPHTSPNHNPLIFPPLQFFLELIEIFYGIVKFNVV